MYCSNCGKELAKNVKFCKYCGNRIENETDINDNYSTEAQAIKAVNTQSLNNTFNRNVLNNYLYNTRALEFSISKIYDLKIDMENKINTYGFSRFRDTYGWYKRDWSATDGEAYFYTIGGGLFVIAILLGAGALAKWLFHWSMTAVIILSLLVLMFVVYLLVSQISEENQQQRNHDNEVKQDDLRVANELQEKAILINKLPEVEKELSGLIELRNEAYSVNIIPSKFRNIYAAYFLYDYVSTSEATLSEALLHCDLDTIQQQLNEVIYQQREIISELAYQNALNNQIVAQNQQILNHAIATENNTALAAQYTKISANNTSIVAAIQMSEYLKPNK